MKLTSSKAFAGSVLLGAILILVLLTIRSKFFGEDGSTLVKVIRESVIDKELLSSQFASSFRSNEYPESFDLNFRGSKTRTNVRYTFDAVAQAKMEKLIGQYQPDYGAFVAMDARTGRILSMVSYSRAHSGLDNLALRASFPAASVFKTVTATAALDLNKAMPETIVPFNGANHTLYKKNVEDTRVTRWTRHITMREAFARSVNVFFGKLGLFYVGPASLKQYAERFFFNRQIPSDMPVETGYSKFNSSDPWSIATAASGFTLDNTMSPVQGALIAAAVANDGVIMEPYLIDSLMDQSGTTLYQGASRKGSVVFSPGSAEKIRELFSETVQSGTSRRAFRKTVRRPAYEDVEFGGKTGSLTGLNPAGKCDWFVGYARYRDQRIAVAALTVNEKKWRVKSSTLANEFLTNYIRQVQVADAYAQHRQPAAAIVVTEPSSASNF